MNQKNLAKSLLLFVISINVYSAEYKLDESHTQIGFKVKHLVISTVSGRFNKFSGNIKYDPALGNLEGAKIVISSNSIDTNEPDRDKHLKSEDFFDVTKFPTIEFASKRTITKNKMPVELIGDLTIRGIKKEVKLKIESFGQTKDPWGNERIAFEAATKVDRKDFGLKWNKNLDQGGVMISDEVKLVIEGEAIKVQEEKK
jgi:polyisoprenoid-binding protein YceI